MTWRSYGSAICLMFGIIFISAHEHPDPPLWQQVVVNFIGVMFLLAAVALARRA